MILFYFEKTRIFSLACPSNTILLKLANLTYALEPDILFPELKNFHACLTQQH